MSSTLEVFLTFCIESNSRCKIKQNLWIKNYVKTDLAGQIYLK